MRSSVRKGASRRFEAYHQYADIRGIDATYPAGLSQCHRSHLSQFECTFLAQPLCVQIIETGGNPESVDLAQFLDLALFPLNIPFICNLIRNFVTYAAILLRKIRMRHR